jgi:hypothetical protein
VNDDRVIDVKDDVERPHRLRRLVDALAALLVIVVLLLPNRFYAMTPAAFLRIPVEALAGVAVVLALPRRAARLVVGIGAGLAGLLAIGQIVDAGFAEVLARPFDPVFDAPLLGYAVDFVRTQAGLPGAVGAVVLSAVLLGGIVALSALAARRLAGVVERHRGASIGTAATLGAVWLAAAALGSPVAARTVVADAADRVDQVDTGLRDRAVFAAQTHTDAFAGVPAARLLAGLRGKDVVVAFVESYGRSALESPDLAPRIVPALDAGTRRLAAAGFTARSGWLTSPTFGGGSSLAHATLLSGLWVDNEQRYRSVVGSDRLTLTGAFHRAGWRTVGWEPGNIGDWPEGRFYEYDSVVDSRTMGYRGPSFGWAPMPDEYALSSLGRAEFGPGHRPVLAEIPLVSSHAPWAPLPTSVPWNAVGDGSVFDRMPAEGEQPGQVWPDAQRVRAAYAQSIVYSMDQLVSLVEHYRSDDLAVVVLGDHQPAPIVSGQGASRDVPVTIIAKDPSVLGGVAGWGWDDGLRPAPDAPVWRMDAFRDRFLTAFGSTVDAAGRAAASQATSHPKDQTRATSATTTAGTTTARGRRSATATVRTTP